MTSTTPTTRPATTPAQGPPPPPHPRYGIRAGWIMTASGWSANQFSALLGAYRSGLGLSESAVTGLFALYVVGLIPGLLIGGPLADRLGRRPVALTALALNLASTLLLMCGATSTLLLWPGRFLTGVSAGALLAAGSAWIKELSSPPYVSPSTPATTAARRSGLYVSAGFATGGLAAALIAQWSPHPMVTAYVPHILLAAVAGLAAWACPETMGPAAPAAAGSRTTAEPAATAVGRRSARRNGWAQPTTAGATNQKHQVTHKFGRTVIPLAPWVFAAPATGFVTLPALVHGNVIYAGVASAVVPGTGLLIQPLARRLARIHRLATAVAGLLTMTVALAAAALSVAAEQKGPTLASAAALGAGYGFALTYGLTETTALAPPHQLARRTAHFWTAAYTGMFTPYAFTLLTHSGGPLTPPALLALLSALAAVTCGILLTLNRSS
ncbi:MFS transporter [Actinomycetota bacterium Odt1-20B]